MSVQACVHTKIGTKRNYFALFYRDYVKYSKSVSLLVVNRSNIRRQKNVLFVYFFVVVLKN